MKRKWARSLWWRLGAQGCAVAGKVNGISRAGIEDEVADGEMHIERKDCNNEGKAAGNYGCDFMLLAHQRAEMVGGAPGLAVGRAGFVDNADLGYRKLIKSKFLEKPRFRMNEKEISFDSFFFN